MNRLAECTVGPSKVVRGPLRQDFPTQVTWIRDANGKEVVAWPGFDGVEQPPANADLLAQAYDHALLTAAQGMRFGGAPLAEWMRFGDGFSITVYNVGTFNVPDDGFATPRLTPELRAALMRAVGIDQPGGGK
jgi:hypothetical protein